MLEYFRYVFFALSVICKCWNSANSWVKWFRCSFNVLLKTITSFIYVLTHEYSLKMLFISRGTYASMFLCLITLTFHCSIFLWMTTISLCLSNMTIRHWWKNVIQFITEMYEHSWALFKMFDCRDIEYASCSDILFKSRIFIITLFRQVNDFLIRWVMI